MSKINTGGPAFPVPDLHNNGMTLRDYFAAKAMQGLLSTGDEEVTTIGMAQASYALADAMLKAREGGAA